MNNSRMIATRGILMNIATLQPFLGKRLIIERIAYDPYLSIIAVDGTLMARHEYAGKLPMWLLNQIPNGFSCLSVEEKPTVVELSAIEQSAIQRYRIQKQVKKSNQRKKSQHEALMLSAMMVAMANQR